MKNNIKIGDFNLENLTADEQKKLNQLIKKKESKYNVGKGKSERECDGILFDSVMEMKYYRDVVKQEIENGSITNFELQKKYTLQPSYVHEGKKILPIEYKADFYIEYSDGSSKVIDIKGCADAQALIKRKMFWYVYPDIDYIWIGFSKIDGGWVKYEDIQKGRALRRKEKRKQKEKKDENNEENG